mgnify:CR=1 FL=1
MVSQSGFAKLGLGTWKTWTPVFTGFSTDPAFTARYTQLGKTVTAFVNMEGGISNATTFTMTLPVAAKTGAVQRAHTRVIDNNSNQDKPGMIVTRSGSTTADLFASLQGVGWVASSNKRAYLTIIYETD